MSQRDEHKSPQSNRDETQQKAFLRWANIVLAKHPGQLSPIENLVDAIKDGLTLGHLAEAVIPANLKLPKPKNDLIRVQNITTALNSFEKQGLKLVNIHASAISRGDPKTILGLMFQLCIHYQVQSQSTDSSGKAVSVAQLKQALVEWINEMLSSLTPHDNLAINVIGGIYSEEPLICHNLDKSLVDGTILVGLIAALSGVQLASEVIEQMTKKIEAQLDSNQNPHSFQNDKAIVTTSIAMETALELFDIPLLMDSEDMVLSGDSGANLAYLSYFHNIEIDHSKIAQRTSKSDISVLGDMVHVLKEKAEVRMKEPFAINVQTLDTFDPEEEYSDDVVLFI